MTAYRKYLAASNQENEASTEVNVSESKTLEGMIPIEEFAKREGIAPDRAVAMIRDGDYVGRLVDGEWFAQIEQNPKASSSVSRVTESDPALVGLFNLFAVVSVIGGIALAIMFWPGDPGLGREWEPNAYFWSILWFMSGLIEAALFAAVASILRYLNKIETNTRA